MLAFRPYPLLTVLTLGALGILLWLGSWQLDRRAWKADLLADFAATAGAPPLTLEAALCGDEAAPGRPVDRVEATAASPEIRVYGRSPQGGPGWRVFAAVDLPACASTDAMLMEVRFDPLQTASAGPMGRPEAPSAVTALRFERPAGAGAFTPPSSLDTNEFYAFDAVAMGERLDRTVLADWWLAADNGEPPAHLTQTPPERHMAYAITWFTMAIALLGVYLAFHIKAGRIGRKP